MADLSRFRERLTRSAGAAVSAAARDVALEVAGAAPVVTGLMASRITSRPLDMTGPVMSAVVRINVPYAEPVIFGSKPHVITAKNAHGMLVFPSGGVNVFVHGGRTDGPPLMASVNHPGNDPNPFPDAVTDTFGVRVADILADYMRVG